MEHDSAKVTLEFNTAFTLLTISRIFNTLSLNKIYLQKLARLDEISMGIDEDKPPQSATAVIRGLELFVPLTGLIDINIEIQRLDKQIQYMKGRLLSVNNRLKNKKFIDRAPENVINHEINKQKKYEIDLAKLEKNMEALQT